jgi:pyridoxal phosphate enzyme (YggS family)
MESNNVHPVQNILGSINEAAKRGDRSATNITLVAVSKTRPIEDIVAAYEAGVRHFGENRTKELAEKAAALSHLPDIQWHFIGNLQTRQSEAVAEHANCFHAVDRIKIAEKLSTQLQKLDRTLPVFIEVNISGEESKGGFECADWENNQEQRDTISHAMRSIAALPNIPVRGLMTMAPWTAPEATVRDIFSRLRRLSEWLNSHFPELQATELSMGMSGDFEIAIEEGATCVRVGSAIFGKQK